MGVTTVDAVDLVEVGLDERPVIQERGPGETVVRGEVDELREPAVVFFGVFFLAGAFRSCGTGRPVFPTSPHTCSA